MDGSSSLDCWSSSLSVASDDSEAYVALSLMSAAAGFLVESKSDVGFAMEDDFEDGLLGIAAGRRDNVV